MRNAHLRRLPLIVGFALLRFECPNLRAQDDIAQLLKGIDGTEFDWRALRSLETYPPDPRIIPGLEAAFEQRDAKKEKQAIAATLIRLGARSSRYYDFLAEFARAAVEDRTPFFMKEDSNGQAIRGELSPQFENWCATHGQDPKSVAAVQFGYHEDVLVLAETQDPRARELFREGLESPNPLVVAASVQGLGRLQDIGALSVISVICDRLPRGGWLSIAMQLPWFARPEADALMARLVPDRKLREGLAGQVQRMRLDEIERVRRRTASTPK